MIEIEPPQPIRWSDYTLTAEQEIRARAIEAATRLLQQRPNVAPPYVVFVAKQFEEYIKTGREA